MAATRRLYFSREAADCRDGEGKASGQLAYRRSSSPSGTRCGLYGKWDACPTAPFLNAALGFSPETEIRTAPGVIYAGAVPAEIQIALPYVAAMVTRTAQADAGRALLAFLATAPARAAFAQSGVRLQ